MHERGKAVEVGLIECQTCEKKIYVVKKNLGKIFLKFFSLNLILLYILNYFYHFQPFLYYKKCAYLKEVIRRDFDQCEMFATYKVFNKSHTLVENSPWSKSFSYGEGWCLTFSPSTPPHFFSITSLTFFFSLPIKIISPAFW